MGTFWPLGDPVLEPPLDLVVAVLVLHLGEDDVVVDPLHVPFDVVAHELHEQVGHLAQNMRLQRPLATWHAMPVGAITALAE